MTTKVSRSAVLRSAAVALVAAAGLAVGMSPALAAYPPRIVPCDLGQTVDELTKYGDAKQNNVIVFMESARDSAHFEGVVKQGSAKAWGCNEVGDPWNNKRTYHWVVFQGKGTFVRKGDGGYRNWAFFGVFDRVSDKKVVFHAR